MLLSVIGIEIVTRSVLNLYQNENISLLSCYSVYAKSFQVPMLYVIGVVYQHLGTNRTNGVILHKNVSD